jgi:phosphate transport system permease protein
MQDVTERETVPQIVEPRKERRSRGENPGDRLFRLFTFALAGLIVVLVGLLLGTMIHQAWPAIREFGFGFFVGSRWNPVVGLYGAWPAIAGTLVTSALALIIAVPVGILAAIFLAELAPRWIAGPLSFVIELLAAIPSVVIGLWGLFVLVPWIRPLERWLGDNLGFVPLFHGAPIGIGVFAAGFVLAVMVLPILTAVSRDVLRAVPRTQREAMLALGATRWEMITRSVLPYGRSGLVGAVILGLGRALGETLAVTMVIGNTYQIKESLFAPGVTLASLIASQFREADTKMYLSAIIYAAVVLFIITMLVNIAARLLVWRVNSRGSRR